MFTGIIEALGELKSIQKEGTNIHFEVFSPFKNEVKIDQSIAHDGVCLTVTEIKGDSFMVTAIDETLNRTALSEWAVGKKINLERCMKADARFDGHIVQGHVDQTARVKEIENKDGSWKYVFEYDPKSGNITVEKGSICINGVSLTVVDSGDDFFSVAIIPYTYEHTTFHQLEIGSEVNLEFDIIGKYVAKLLANQSSNNQ